MVTEGNWFRPDQYTITFHAVGAIRDAALQRYLAEHNVHSSADVSRALLMAS